MKGLGLWTLCLLAIVLGQDAPVSHAGIEEAEGIVGADGEQHVQAARQDSDHAHLDDHQHEHEHEHAHDHHHEHEHGHEHAHDHQHDHGHRHEHAHDHQHEHAHDHQHEHGHDHAHDHQHEHGHDHAHDHQHDHGHEHEHAHDHQHDHGHEHEHGHTPSAPVKLYPLTAISLTFLSGMSAVLGGLLVLCLGMPSPRLLGHLLSFAAGIMLYLSYGDLLVHAIADMDIAMGEAHGHGHAHDHAHGHGHEGHSHGGPGAWAAHVWMFAGAVGFTALAWAVGLLHSASLGGEGEGSHGHSHAGLGGHAGQNKKEGSRERTSVASKAAGVDAGGHAGPGHTAAQGLSPHRLWLTGLVAALGITLHNLPEGLIVYNQTIGGLCSDTQPRGEGQASTLPAWLLPAADALGLPADPRTCVSRGLAVTLAIALHNVPEGMAVASPIYASTGSKWKALQWTILSSVAEPLAALLFGYFLYTPTADGGVQGGLSRYTLAAINACVAGIMVALCLVELVPAAAEAAGTREAALSNLLGQAVMYVSLHAMRGAGVH